MVSATASRVALAAEHTEVRTSLRLGVFALSTASAAERRPLATELQQFLRDGNLMLSVSNFMVISLVCDGVVEAFSCCAFDSEEVTILAVAS